MKRDSTLSIMLVLLYFGAKVVIFQQGAVSEFSQEMSDAL